MTDQHPITPPPELLSRWEEDWHHGKVKHTELEDHIATQAAQWGADQELEACCEWMDNHLFSSPSTALRAARRPPPPSLKERALQAWAAVEAGTDDQAAMTVIRRALNELPN